ncbi:MAG: hypothetical protein AB2692_16785 [Candidatus Thiodiazotropha sp.]
MIIQGENVTECWLKTLIAMADGPHWELSPFIAQFKTGSKTPVYTDELESDLNDYLESVGQPHINTTAGTIFPQSLTGGSEDVFDRFDRIWKYIKKDKRNYKGHYFRRLVAYNEQNGRRVNQLKHIIDTYNGIEGVRHPVHRRSALIALTFDPTVDHTAQPLRGFPCLQQICLVPKNDGEVTLNAIYAMQHLADRAYGNYVGLENLGHYMAGEMGLELVEVNCIASVLELGKMKKSVAKEFAEKYKQYA